MRVHLRALVLLGTAAASLAPVADAQIARELAGSPRPQFPFFEYVRAYNEGDLVGCAIDPGTNPALVGLTVDIYVCDSQDVAGWNMNPALVDVSDDGANTETISGTDIQSNRFPLDSGSLSGDAGMELGVPYDIVIDVNQNGTLDAGDYIDGYSDTQAGFYVCHDTTQPGPLAVSTFNYDLSGGTFDRQELFFPTNIASMGELPLVVVSHGNGHNYQWYDHIGEHLASYGYIVMSHENNTVPGVFSASTTTLTNTDDFLSNLGTIAGGQLVGHVDTNSIIWIGHSRGGEGVVIAYDRIFDGTYTPINYTIDDIILVSSMAPVDFLGSNQTDPHGVPFHLWTAGADGDVNGCADCNLCQTFHLHERAEEYRQSVSIHGVGHGDYHNGPTSSVAAGSVCLVGRPDTHRVMRGYLLPLVEHYYQGNVPAKDYLTRQYESFAPPGAPTSNPCVVVQLMYRDGSDAPGKIVLDDFQSNPSDTQSSLGISVGYTVSNLTEGDMDDNNTTFTDLASDPWNGFTHNGTGADDSAGVVFEWDGTDSYYAYIVPGGGPVGLWKYISFRAAQAPRDALTNAVLGDLDFNVTLVDTSLNFSRISVTAFGGGIEEPYQRTAKSSFGFPGTCGTGVGWAAEFETIRIPIEAFTYNNSGINLNSILAVGFEFGPSHGSNEGRIGLDDVELLLD